MRQPPGPDDPTTVGRFRIVGVLGSCVMGRVLLGEDADGRPAAIKVVHAELLGDEGFRARFRREIRLAAQAPPGWTAPFLDADPDAERPWLATAFLDAPSLQEHLSAHGQYPPLAAAQLGSGLAAALSALHSAGLVHRDLKPSNVLLTDGGPRLIDFGISRAVDGTALTATGQSVGTPEYMSPEQVIGAEAGPPSDVFSLGSLLVFAVRGRTPFAAGSPTGALYRVVHDEPDLPAVLGPLTPVLQACLAKDPAERPRAPEVRDRLAALGAGGGAPEQAAAAGGTLFAPTPGTGRPDDVRQVAGPQEPPTARVTAVGPGWAPPSQPPLPTMVGRPPGPPPPEPRPRDRRPLMIVGAVLLAALLGAGATFGVLALRPDPATPGPVAGGPSSNPFAPPSTGSSPSAQPADITSGATVVDTSQDIRFGDPSDRLTFASPSRNIACALGPFDVRCDVVERTWQVPPRPASCQLAYGTGAELAGAATAELTCAGDTVADPSLPALDYGRALRTREVACVSRTDGVECRNSTTGHGFLVSRGAYRLY